MKHAIQEPHSLARRSFLRAAAAAALGMMAGNASGAEETMLQFLPSRIANWRQAGEDRVFTRETIFDYMDGAGEIYLAYDFRRLLVREYEKRAAPRLVAELYEMSSSEDAYGVFSHDTDGQVLRLGQGAIYSAGLLRLWKDRFFVRLLAETETSATKAAVLALGTRIAAAIPGAGKEPRLLACLPASGLERVGVRYFHTQVSLNAHYFLADANLLNLSPKTEAVLARYRRAGGKLRLLLCRYPDSTAAQSAFDQFNRIYFRDKSPPKAARRIEAVEKGEFVGLRWHQAFVILVFEAGDRKTCETFDEAVLARVKEVYR